MTDTNTEPTTVTEADELHTYSHDLRLAEEPTVEARLRKFETEHSITLAGDALALFEAYAPFFRSTRLVEPLTLDSETDI